jgi:hypothetical protein
MFKSEVKLIGFSLILIAFLYIFSLINKLNYSIALISSVIFGLLSIIMVYRALLTDRRNILIWNTIIFFTSIFIFVTQYFQVLNISALIIPSVLFCGGLVLLMLFIQNNINKSLFYSSILFFIFFGIFIYFRNTLLVNKINYVVELLLSYKLILLFLLAAFLIWNKKIKY